MSRSPGTRGKTGKEPESRLADRQAKGEGRAIQRRAGQGKGQGRVRPTSQDPSLSRAPSRTRGEEGLKLPTLDQASIGTVSASHESLTSEHWVEHQHCCDVCKTTYSHEHAIKGDNKDNTHSYFTVPFGEVCKDLRGKARPFCCTSVPVDQAHLPKSC